MSYLRPFWFFSVISISTKFRPVHPLTRQSRYMRRRVVLYSLLFASVLGASLGAQSTIDPAFLKPGRDPKQAIDEEYTKKILENTTEKFFLSPLVDYLPASKTVPT